MSEIPNEREPSPEDERTTEEALLKTDIDDLFEQHADIIGIAHVPVDRGPSVAVTVLAGGLDMPDTILPILVLARAHVKGGATDIIHCVFGPLKERQGFGFDLEDGGGLIMMAEGAPRAAPDVVETVRELVHDAEWNERLSRSVAKRISDGEMVLFAQ